MDFRICQTSTATPAEPGGLSLTLDHRFHETDPLRLRDLVRKILPSSRAANDANLQAPDEPAISRTLACPETRQERYRFGDGGTSPKSIRSSAEESSADADLNR
jgi:hypothetical protein